MIPRNEGSRFQINVSELFPMRHGDMLMIRNPDGSRERIRVTTFITKGSDGKERKSHYGTIEKVAPAPPRKIANRVTPFTEKGGLVYAK